MTAIGVSRIVLPGLPAGALGTVLCCDPTGSELPIMVTFEGWAQGIGTENAEWCSAAPGSFPPGSAWQVSCSDIMVTLSNCCDLAVGDRVPLLVDDPGDADDLQDCPAPELRARLQHVLETRRTLEAAQKTRHVLVALYLSKLRLRPTGELAESLHEKAPQDSAGSFLTTFFAAFLPPLTVRLELLQLLLAQQVA